MKHVCAKTTNCNNLEHDLSLLQLCGYTINNVFQNHYTSYGESRESYTIIYERDEYERNEGDE